MAELTQVCGRTDFFYCGRIDRVAELTGIRVYIYMSMHTLSTREHGEGQSMKQTQQLLEWLVGELSGGELRASYDRPLGELW